MIIYPGSRPVPATYFASIHTSASVRASHPLNKRARREKRAVRATIIAKERPHPVLGTRTGDNVKWPNCDLAKVLVTEEELTTRAEPRPLTLPSGVLWMPRVLNYGVGEPEVKMLFEDLPALSAEQGGLRSRKWTASAHAVADQKELVKSNMLARVIDLRNANAGGIAFENRRRVIAAFSGPGITNDSGSPEVQGTYNYFDT